MEDRTTEIRLRIAELAILGFECADDQGEWIRSDEAVEIERLIVELKSLLLWPGLHESDQ